MTRHRPTTLAAVALAVACAFLPLPARPADPGQLLVLEQTIVLGHVSGRIDHLAVDLHRRRLFVAELGNDSVDVIDLASGTRLHRIGGLKAPQGVAYVPASDAIVVANADDGSVHFYRGGDFAELGVLNLESDADNARVDPGTGQVVVGYGEGRSRRYRSCNSRGAPGHQAPWPSRILPDRSPVAPRLRQCSQCRADCRHRFCRRPPGGDMGPPRSGRKLSDGDRRYGRDRK